MRHTAVPPEGSAAPPYRPVPAVFMQRHAHTVSLIHLASTSRTWSDFRRLKQASQFFQSEQPLHKPPHKLHVGAKSRRMQVGGETGQSGEGLQSIQPQPGAAQSPQTSCPAGPSAVMKVLSVCAVQRGSRSPLWLWGLEKWIEQLRSYICNLISYLFI